MTRKSSATNKIGKERGSRKEHQPLTDREWLVLQRVAEGMSNQEIAERLTLSLTTVKWYIKQIFNKLGAERRTQAIQVARSRGLIMDAQSQFGSKTGLHPLFMPLIGRENEIRKLTKILEYFQDQLQDVPMNSSIEKTGDGRFGNHFPPPGFAITPELIDRLLNLLDEVEKT